MADKPVATPTSKKTAVVPRSALKSSPRAASANPPKSGATATPALQKSTETPASDAETDESLSSRANDFDDVEFERTAHAASEHETLFKGFLISLSSLIDLPRSVNWYQKQCSKVTSLVADAILGHLGFFEPLDRANDKPVDITRRIQHTLGIFDKLARQLLSLQPTSGDGADNQSPAAQRKARYDAVVEFLRETMLKPPRVFHDWLLDDKRLLEQMRAAIPDDSLLATDVPTAPSASSLPVAEPAEDMDVTGVAAAVASPSLSASVILLRLLTALSNLVSLPAALAWFKRQPDQTAERIAFVVLSELGFHERKNPGESAASIRQRMLDTVSYIESIAMSTDLRGTRQSVQEMKDAWTRRRDSFIQTLRTKTLAAPRRFHEWLVNDTQLLEHMQAMVKPKPKPPPAPVPMSIDDVVNSDTEAPPRQPLKLVVKRKAIPKQTQPAADTARVSAAPEPAAASVSTPPRSTSAPASTPPATSASHPPKVKQKDKERRLSSEQPESLLPLPPPPPSPTKSPPPKKRPLEHKEGESAITPVAAPQTRGRAAKNKDEEKMAGKVESNISEPQPKKTKKSTQPKKEKTPDQAPSSEEDDSPSDSERFQKPSHSIDASFNDAEKLSDWLAYIISHADSEAMYACLHQLPPAMWNRFTDVFNRVVDDEERKRKQREAKRKSRAKLRAEKQQPNEKQE